MWSGLYFVFPIFQCPYLKYVGTKLKFNIVDGYGECWRRIIIYAYVLFVQRTDYYQMSQACLGISNTEK